VEGRMMMIQDHMSGLKEVLHIHLVVEGPHSQSHPRAVPRSQPVQADPGRRHRSPHRPRKAAWGAQSAVRWAVVWEGLIPRAGRAGGRGLWRHDRSHAAAAAGRDSRGRAERQRAARGGGRRSPMPMPGAGRAGRVSGAEG
jgi:hypothetical protein